MQKKKRKKGETLCKSTNTIHKKIESNETLYTASFSEDEQLQMMLANQVLVYYGSGNVMKLKLRLLPFSLICTQN